MSDKNREKLKGHLEHTRFLLRNFESSLKDWQKKAVSTDHYPLDDQYSKAHPDEEREQVSFAGEFEDPHLIPTQREIRTEKVYAQDTEESEGTMEDYENYKASQ